MTLFVVRWAQQICLLSRVWAHKSIIKICIDLENLKKIKDSFIHLTQPNKLGTLTSYCSNWAFSLRLHLFLLEKIPVLINIHKRCGSEDACSRYLALANCRQQSLSSDAGDHRHVLLWHLTTWLQKISLCFAGHDYGTTAREEGDVSECSLAQQAGSACPILWWLCWYIAAVTSASSSLL